MCTLQFSINQKRIISKSLAICFTGFVFALLLVTVLLG